MKNTVSITHRTETLIILGLFCGVFVTGADSFIISALLPAIASSLHTSASVAAYGVTIYALCYAVGAPLFGPLGDRLNKRRLLFIGCFVFLIGTMLCGLANSLITFYLYRAIAGIGAALFVPNVWAFIGGYFSGSRLNQVMGIVMSALSLSIAIGVPLGTSLSQLGDWHMAFWGSAILTCFALLILIVTVPDLKTGKKHAGGYFESFATVARTPHAVPGLLITLCWMSGFYSIYTFLGTFAATTFHLNTAQTGYIFIAYGLANFIASFFGGHLMTKFGKKHSVIINGLVSFLAVLAIGTLGTNLFALLTLLVILALVQGFGVTALTAYIVNVVPSNRSTVMSFNSSFLYLGLTIGSAIGGLLFSQFGFLAITIGAAICLLIAVLITVSLGRYQTDQS
ncbi:MFS transporter [Lacticaseibacillus chiayiensis]|uniref:MFS transporter n=1 Tax=Lacticaseibacillus chiayiensis TaxID=2100821 RepID=UPI001EDF196A|nr:MFS transporter [Lacticaseibacillus chiayiensis]